MICRISVQKHLPLLISMALLHLPFPLEGQQAPAATVRAKRPLPPNAVRMDGKELQGLLIGASADDPYGILSILSLKAGITFRSTGDPGAENWFMIRNFGRDNSRLTLVVVDGRPINLSNNFTVEFDDIPVAVIDQITIYFGPVPVRYGGFHTVVEIRTVKPRSRSGLISAAGGSQETVRTNLVVEDAGRFSWLANLNFDQTAGQTGQRLTGVLSDWRYTNRTARMFNPYLKSSVDTNRGFQLNAHAQFTELEKYYGDGLHYGRPEQRRRSQQGFFLEAASSENARTDFALSGYLNLENEFLNARFPENPQYNVHWGDQQRQRFGVMGHLSHSLGDRLALTFGGEAHRSRGRTNDDYVFFRYISSQSHYGTYLEWSAAPWKNATLLAGGRLDGQTTVGSLRPAWQLSLEQELKPNRFSAYASVGKSNRWIPLNEVNTFLRPASLLGPPFLRAGFTEPARNLTLEEFRSVEGGVKYRSARIQEFRLGFFSHRLIGPTGTTSFEVVPIQPAPGIPPGFSASLASFERNVPVEQRSSGLEVSVSGQMTRDLMGFANYSCYFDSDTRARPGVSLYAGPLGGPAAQEALNASINAMVIPGVGRANIPGAYTMLGNIGVMGNVRKSTAVTLLGRWRGTTRDPIMKFGMDPQTGRIGGNVTWDVGVNQVLSRTDTAEVAAFVKAVNVFDKQFSTFVHYPMSGRTVYTGLILSWNSRSAPKQRRGADARVSR